MGGRRGGGVDTNDGFRFIPNNTFHISRSDNERHRPQQRFLLVFFFFFF